MREQVKGFTLIELLVVISIIGILAAIGLNTYPRAQAQARDSQRKSDLNQYRVGLEGYANQNNGLFPGGAEAPGGIPARNLCNIAGWSNFMSSCPEDSQNSQDPSFQYKYSGDGSTGLSTKYVLWAKLEISNNTYWVICSDGRTGIKSQSGFSVSAGNCPL